MRVPALPSIWQLLSKMPISPGLITESNAAELNRWLQLVATNKRRAEALSAGLPSKFPAAVTAYDSTTGRYDWYEQAIDETGQRYTKDAGRFGSTAQNPAYAYGDGQHLTSFPTPVVMSERVIHTSGGVGLGMGYEFNLYCGCVGGGSGGTGYVLVSCCSNPIPGTLYCTVSVPGFPCADGVVIPLVWDTVSNRWASKAAFPLELNWFPACVGGSTVAPIWLYLYCVCIGALACTFKLGISSGTEGGAGIKFATFPAVGSGAAGTMYSSGAIFPGTSVFVCSPFSSYFDRSDSSGGAVTLSGNAVTFYITE